MATCTSLKFLCCFFYLRAHGLDFIETWSWDLFYSCWFVQLRHEPQAQNRICCRSGSRHLPPALQSHHLPPLSLIFWRSENPSSEVKLYSQNQSQRTEDVWNGLGFRDGQLWPNHLFLYLLSCPKILFNHSEWDSLFPTFCFVLEQYLRWALWVLTCLV